MQSIQDTQITKGFSIGGSISGNILASTPTDFSVNGGKTKGSKEWVEEVTRLNANEKITVVVNEKTTLKGATITNLDKDAKEKEQITRATIGSGIINISDPKLDAESKLNRDTNKIQEITKDKSSNLELYASDNSIKAILDPVKTKNDIIQYAKDLGLAAHKEIQENIPSAKDDEKGIINNTIGTLLDEVSFLGILPSKENDGGYVSQIATQLFGDNRNVLVVEDRSILENLKITDIQKKTIINEDGSKRIVYTTNPNKTVRITKDAQKDGNLDDMKIYISEADAKEMKIQHLFTNGIMNSSKEALTNQQSQQGNPEIAMLNYNQSHGILGDSIEMTQEKVAVTTNITQLATGGARQTGKIKSQLTDLNDGKLLSSAHSQGTMQDYLGTKLNQDTISTVVKNNPNNKYLTQYSGSPVNSDAVGEMVTEIYGGEEALLKRTDNKGIVDVFRSQVNPGDPVALLGGNTAGINNQDNLMDNIFYSLDRGVPTMFNGGLENNLDNPYKTSSHSGYKCVIGCGEGGVTPSDYKKYYNPLTNKEINLQDFYKEIHVDPRISNVYIPELDRSK